VCNLLPLAGPIATIIAAVAAVFVTWRLGRGQLQIARQQVEIAQQQATTSRHQAEIAKQLAAIAFDRLRFDLFEKRYAIFTAIKELLKYLVNLPRAESIDALTVVKYFVILDEAPFFFPEAFCVFLQTVKDACQLYYETRNQNRGEPTSPQWVETAREIARQETQLAQYHRDMPVYFASVMKFEQLTRPPSPT
jgi:hypothetical protein